MDTHMKNYIFDKINKKDWMTLDMIASESFLRRAAQYNLPFMLKGSLITRQYMPNPQNRVSQDIDWVYMDRITIDEANEIFTDWMIKVSESDINDIVKFTSFKENAFWRGIDYAMADDFPTVNTDLEYSFGENPQSYSSELSIDISFNLDIDVEPVPLLYKPLFGEPFTIPYTPPLSLQIAWKLHQTIVRPRFKDLYDLTYLFEHPSYDTKAVKETLQALVNECYADKIDNTRILNIFTKKGWEQIYYNNIDNPNYPHYYFYDYYFKTYIGDIGNINTKENFYNFREQFCRLLDNIGLNETIVLPEPKANRRSK